MMRHMDIEPLKHQFLLAMPTLGGSYFGNSITYVCEHNRDGAMGLMINRPSKMTLGDLFDQLELEGPENRDLPVLEGGPVQAERGFILHSNEFNPTASRDLGAGLALSTSREALQAIAAGEGPKQFLITLGYAGWGAGQLESELGDNSWLTCPGSTEVIFDVPFDDRVQSAANGLGIDFTLISGQAGYA